MGLTSLQVCMDSSDWLLQGAIHEENNNGMDSSSSPSGGDMLTCTMPPAMMDQRRLRPPHDQALKCPRCDSAHTKFCYYNNYSLTQPRYFCKTCRRYWTKGGTLRNIPVGGGCRKNKKVSSSSKKSNNNDHHQPPLITNNNQNPERSSPSPSQYSADFRVSQINNLLGTTGHNGSSLGSGGFSLLGGHETSPIMPIDFMECSRNNLGMVSGINGDFSGATHGLGPNFHGLCSPFGFSLEGMENYQRLMLPYEGGGGGGGVLSNDDNNNYQNGIDVKPNTKLLSLDNWQDQNQGCSDAGKDYSSIGYHLNGLGSWSGMMNNGF